MRKIVYFSSVVIVGLLCLNSVDAKRAVRRTPKLKMGDPAPALQVGRWLKGDPVTKFQPNMIYVVEFWATWCGPCHESIPHLSKLAKQYQPRGVVVIGVNIWEDEDDAAVKFVQKQGPKMAYRIALDDKSQTHEGAMATTWMKAARENGIPTAFVVGKDGRIAWIGDPRDDLDAVIQKLSAGRQSI